MKRQLSRTTLFTVLGLSLSVSVADDRESDQEFLFSVTRDGGEPSVLQVNGEKSRVAKRVRLTSDDATIEIVPKNDRLEVRIGASVLVTKSFRIRGPFLGIQVFTGDSPIERLLASEVSFEPRDENALECLMRLSKETELNCVFPSIAVAKLKTSKPRKAFRSQPLRLVLSALLAPDRLSFEVEEKFIRVVPSDASR